MIELSGLELRDDLNPEGDIEIQVTGLRPGEKLYEELLIGDNPLPTAHPRILRAQEEFLPLADLELLLAQLEEGLSKFSLENVKVTLKKLVSGYAPS
jgi:FlaA1/EpsC-like NDP-sugar epimerase